MNTPADAIRGLYLITDHGDNLVARVEAAVRGGVRVVQFRSKTHAPEERLTLGSALARLCREQGIPFIVNDDLELACRLDADGVHLGQDDGDPRAARARLGAGKIIGVSTHNRDEALAAEAAGADYIGLGAMYPSGSKDIEHLAGPAAVAVVKACVTIPVVAIGGITRDNAAPIIDGGADSLAVISAVLGSADPALAAAELALLFNRRQPFPKGSVLTVAGSDSGGGAGIQADLKTITLLGSYGASVITALTAQNTRGVTAIHGAPAAFVAGQLTTVLSDIPVDVVKTGMLFSSEIIATVARQLAAFHKRLVVVDPVMIAKGGASLIDTDAVTTLKRELLPLTYLLTPNIPEAEALTGLAIGDETGMEAAGRAIGGMGVANVLIKGGHLAGAEATDLLFDGQEFKRFTSPRLASTNTHGTGCTLASAIATFLARGEPLPMAIARAKEFITAAIRLARPLGSGHGPVNHFEAAREANLGRC
ncbi:bifunctional hydroxymethylpyrimidine kinase/phosphomethylpyrimidine kinase [Geobacter argillaceus]|uniref:Thiamine-phosphate synthase n=1 Tax=Geobacter argillaceus TaxID=345631 RepID=A0A562WRN2_9BACT|nr:bifunctional hydroxymethylpyrimidine kinase/phosphomethylpyrimidine kinase [Geobacter argillaceus]TWJ33069.1 hydroxymethylpyrimidine kinase/phosphomethylpyrimidine kinase/thiamine-phosphate diphosphorylase [Geobacter argillaceus]